MSRVGFKAALAVTSATLAYIAVLGLLEFGDSASGGDVVTGFTLRGLMPVTGAVLTLSGILSRSISMVWVGAGLVLLSTVLLVFSIGLALVPAALALLAVAIFSSGRLESEDRGSGTAVGR